MCYFWQLASFSEEVVLALRDPERWPLLLEDVCRVVMADGAGLNCLSAGVGNDAPRTTRRWVTGLAPTAERQCLAAIAAVPTAEAVLAMPVGALATIQTPAFMRIMVGVVGRRDDGAELLVLTRLGANAVAFDKADRVAAEIVCRLSTALRLHEHLAGSRGPLCPLGAEMLSALTIPVVLIQPGCRFAWANSAGEALIASDDALRVHSGRLTTAHSPERGRLASLIAGAFEGRTSTMVLERSSGQPLVVSAAPLAGEPVGEAGPQAVILIAQQIQRQRSAAETERLRHRLRQLWSLTPAEAHVLLAVNDAPSRRVAADALGLAEATVQTHLSRSFQKAGLHSQRDLARVVGAIESLAN